MKTVVYGLAAIGGLVVAWTAWTWLRISIERARERDLYERRGHAK